MRNHTLDYDFPKQGVISLLAETSTKVALPWGILTNEYRTNFHQWRKSCIFQAKLKFKSYGIK
ncbi:MAG: hypothetical protein SNJ29_14060 [Rikenellaceae bacterium]